MFSGKENNPHCNSSHLLFILMFSRATVYTEYIGRFSGLDLCSGLQALTSARRSSVRGVFSPASMADLLKRAGVVCSLLKLMTLRYRKSSIFNWFKRRSSRGDEVKQVDYFKCSQSSKTCLVSTCSWLVQNLEPAV